MTAAIQPDVPPVRRSILVAAPRETAFRVFTEGIGRWWLLGTHHIGAAPAVGAVIEPREGGRWYERSADGAETPWGEVLTWDPPARLVLAWRIGADWKFDARLHTEVEVRFSAEGPGRTRVDLEHRKLEAYAAAAHQVRAAFDSEGGWPGLLAAYAEAAERG